MTSRFITALILAFTFNASANDVDWSVCKADLDKTGCSKEKDDHGKHECLEKKGKGKVSKECDAFNHKLEAKMKEKHHKHDDGEHH